MFYHFLKKKNRKLFIYCYWQGELERKRARKKTSIILYL